MTKRTYLFPTFISCLIFSIALFFLFHNRNFDNFHMLISPIQQLLLHVRQNRDSVHDGLEQQNAQLRSQLAQMELLEKENQALKDQFQITNNQSQTMLNVDNHQLLPAHIVSLPEFLPGIHLPTTCIIDKGQKDGVYEGQPVVIRNILIGIVSRTTDNFSEVIFIFSSQKSLAVKTARTSALGVLKGKGGHVTLENVVLSDSLSGDDAVVTLGTMDIHGRGIPSGLMIGTISSVEKNASALFQKANIKPLVDITKLATVFLVTQP